MKRNAFTTLLILGIFSILFFFGCNKKSNLNPADFDTFVDNIFKTELSCNTINLHYTLKDPSSYGIEDYPITLNSYSKETFLESGMALENYQSTLSSFSYNSLSSDQKITYDILEDFFATELSVKNLYLYAEPLNEFSGVQTQLPILLAEYRFDSEKDVEEYLFLLSLLDGYFEDVLAFEERKSQAGLFMSSSSAEKIIEQCSLFIENPDSNYLIDTFSDRLNSLTNLSSEKKESYVNANKNALLHHVIPAYKKLISGLTALKNSGTNEQGLRYFTNGKEYYEYLVKYNTGSSRSLKEIALLIETQRIKDLTASTQIIQENPAILSNSQTSLNMSTPEEMVEYLKKQCEKDFPTPIDVNYSIKYVHDSLEDVLGPAFYLQPPIDNPSNNLIYINRGSSYTSLELFTTLAHEGYPGHLYQTVMSAETSTSPLLSITNYCGYSEGWATYVEMYSYSLAGINKDLANLLQMDRSILLSLYSSLDLGIHYDGWTLKDAENYLKNYGIKDKNAIKEMYHTIVGNPAYYLRYYVGYLEFLSLRDTAKEALGDNFNLKEFHRFLIEFGPAPFSVIEEYMQKWIDSQKSQS